MYKSKIEIVIYTRICIEYYFIINMLGSYLFIATYHLSHLKAVNHEDEVLQLV
jgi:hypothetical protein